MKVLFKPWILFFLSITGISYVQAQDSLFIRYQEALEKAYSNNKELLMANTDQAIAKSQYRQSDQAFLPQVSASYSALTTNNPLYAFGFKLQQQSISQSDFMPDLLNSPERTNNFQTNLEVRQPLFNADALYLRKAASRMVEMQQFKSERLKEYVTFQVQSAYSKMQLLEQSVYTWSTAVNFSNEMLNNIQKRYDQGLVQKADLLNAQVQNRAMENSYTEAKSEYRNACDQLSLVMGEPVGKLYKVESLNTGSSVVVVSDLNIDQRSDILAMKKGLESYQYKANSSLSKFVPRINAMGNYFMNDKEALGFNSNSYFAGISLQWDIFKGNAHRFEYKTSRLEKSKLEQQLSYEKEKSAVELEKTVRQINDLKERVSQSELAIQQSEEALKLMKNRYELGLVSTTELLLSESQWAQQRLNAHYTYYGLSVAQAYYAFLNPIQ